MKKIIKVSNLSRPLRLDKYLKSQLSRFSRERIISFIRQGKVTIEGKAKIKASYLLKEGELIILDLPDIFKKTKDFSLQPISLSPEPKILYENKNLLVLDKPAGLVVHPTITTLGRPSLAAWLISKYPFLKKVGEDKLRPGIVHRLDKDTSGVLIVAKNNPTFFYLKDLFKKREIHKKYIALVEGEVKQEKGIIKRAILPSRQGAFKRRVVNSRDQKRHKAGKAAITFYEVKRCYKAYTLLEVKPQTGRTHQIRVHLASIGCPIVGDRIYGRRKDRGKCLLSRHFLHAKIISFFTPSGEFLEVEAPMPLELSRFLQTLTLY